MFKMRTKARRAVCHLIDRCEHSRDSVRAFYCAAALLQRLNRDGRKPHLYWLAEALRCRAKCRALERLIAEFELEFERTKDAEVLDVIAEVEERSEQLTLASEAHERHFQMALPPPSLATVASALTNLLSGRQKRRSYRWLRSEHRSTPLGVK
jgi:hypothetical protein